MFKYTYLYSIDIYQNRILEAINTAAWYLVKLKL